MVVQTGGPYYQVELGRLDGKVGTRAVVKHSLPGAGFDLDQLNTLFAANGLTQTDMIALSGTPPPLLRIFFICISVHVGITTWLASRLSRTRRRTGVGSCGRDRCGS
jgi:hypothetical protein